MTQDLQFMIYSAAQSDISVTVMVRDETIWLTQKAMAELFECTPDNISLHLQNIYDSKELSAEATAEDFSVVQKEGTRQVSRILKHYNLDAIISVGYRVNSAKATQFRIWATKTLKEYIQKGFVIDDARLKQGSMIFGKDYFRELLEKIRSIRASERRIWQQITDIYAECSTDYNSKSLVTVRFYAMMQNKFHYAITKKTAAEIISSEADSSKQNMGLTTWKNAPNGRILKSDVKIAKNYLSEREIKRLERIVTGYFDYVEDLIESEHAFTMEQFVKSVDEFLDFRKYDILSGGGRISKKQAEKKAEAEYNIFNKTQFIESDFDKTIKNLSRGNKNEQD